MNYSITLTEAQNKALEYVTSDPSDWISHAVNNRCRKAMDEICKVYVDKKLSANEAITVVGRDEMVIAAFAEGIVKTAAEVEVEQNNEPIPSDNDAT